MFEKLKNLLKKVGYKMVSPFKNIKSVSDLERLATSNDYYSKIRAWKELHKGYHKGIHHIQYGTIKGVKSRDIMTMNMPKVSAQEMATLIFNERCRITTSEDNVNDFLENVLKRTKFYGTFQQKLEFMFAQGGLVIEPYVKSNKTSLSYYNADTFFPMTWDGDDITEAAFISSVRKKGKDYTHVSWRFFDENESKYTILNELYESKAGGTFGTKQIWSEFYPGVEETLEIATKKPLFVYVKPNLANNLEPGAVLGLSLYGNALDTLKLIDTIYDSYFREFKLGRKKILVPPEAVRTIHDPRTGESFRYYDSMDETYEVVPSGLDSGEIKEIKMELRVDEHTKALQTALDVYANQLGFSPGTFSFDGQSVKTATEVISENSKTFKTKKSHENLLETGLEHLVYALQVVGVMTGEISAVNEEIDVTVTFDDSIIQDKTAITDDQIKKLNNGIQTNYEAIMVIDGVNEEEAKAKVQRIKEEAAQSLPDFTTLQRQTSLGGSFE